VLKLSLKITSYWFVESLISARRATIIVTAYFLLKGGPRNVSWSVADMVFGRSGLLKGRGSGWMLWGVGERFRWVLNTLPGSGVFIYVTRGQGTRGGLALYGFAGEAFELKQPYWPEGSWPKAFHLNVELAAPGVLEKPEEPQSWRLTPREELAKLGVRVLPGPQKLSSDSATLLVRMLENSGWTMLK